jgi:tetratricopeptide (TPR) repeat protein
LSAAPVLDWQAAADEYSSLAEQALDHGELSHARLGYHMASYVRWANGNWSGAQEETLQAERVTRGASEEEHVIGMAETAKCLAMLERDLSQAEAMLMEAKALAVRSRVNYHAIPAALGLLRFHEGKLDESEEFLKEARTLCKSAGDRVNEFQANEYLVMIDLERGQLESASKRCAALIDIGDKLREGSEAPFAHAINGLCRYGLEDDPEDLEAGLQELRVADAKHRLSYTLTRAAIIDLERGRRESAISRASEALGYAEALERSSEMLLAHEVLAAAYSGHDTTAHQQHTAAVTDLEGTPVAGWVQRRVQSLRGEI